MRSIFFVYILFGILRSAAGQSSSLVATVEVPLMFGVGYEGKISERFSFSLQGGLLTEPNSTIVLNVLEVLGTDVEVVQMIEDSFRRGIVVEAGVNYNFRRYYTGLFLQSIDLRAGNAPRTLIESYFEKDISTYPQKNRRTIPVDEPFLQLSSTLYQGGALIGRRLKLTESWGLNLEFALTANLSSKSMLASEYRDLTVLSEIVETELQSLYRQYAFVPSCNIMLVYRL